MIPHQVVFIHGIGNDPGRFSRYLEIKIRSEFHQTVKRLAPQQSPENGVRFSSAVWYEVTQSDQDTLWNLIFNWMKPRGSFLEWNMIRKDPMNFIYRLMYWSWLRRLVVDYQGDLIAYIESPGANKYRLIHDKVYGAFETCTRVAMDSEATWQNPSLVTVIGHSLGAVIASDLLYDTLKNRGRWWPSQICLANFFTLGSPQAVYALRYGFGPTAFREALRMQDEKGVWINIYDRQDVIAYPLKRLNEAYEDAVFFDKEINVGQWWNLWHLIRRYTPLNHDLYLEDNCVAAIVGRKASLDWLRSNRIVSEVTLREEYRTYADWIQQEKWWKFWK
ncbi:MAG: hypothetical protein GDA67_12115 [Nitrospira sp. CR1.3]|nr:hypothetical protein [Nitrospira sp. CR1.3]